MAGRKRRFFIKSYNAYRWKRLRDVPPMPQLNAQDDHVIGDDNSAYCEIEITPEMVRAGLHELSYYSPLEDPVEFAEETVKEIFCAMLRHSSKTVVLSILKNSPVFTDEYIRLGKPDWPSAENAICSARSSSSS